MRSVDRATTLVWVSTALLTSTPAFAGVVTPAPVAGIGVGAVLLLGAGYRLIKRRIDK